jgi:hypothetical protein
VAKVPPVPLSQTSSWEIAMKHFLLSSKLTANKDTLWWIRYENLFT